jgi:hypothetical protein
MRDNVSPASIFATSPEMWHRKMNIYHRLA